MSNGYLKKWILLKRMACEARLWVLWHVGWHSASNLCSPIFFAACFVCIVVREVEMPLELKSTCRQRVCMCESPHSEQFRSYWMNSLHMHARANLIRVCRLLTIQTSSIDVFIITWQALLLGITWKTRGEFIIIAIVCTTCECGVIPFMLKVPRKKKKQSCRKKKLVILPDRPEDFYRHHQSIGNLTNETFFHPFFSLFAWSV